MRKKLARLCSERLRGFQESMIELPGRLCYHQDHLEECSNEDKCDLRFVVELSGRRATLLMALSFLRPFLFRARENALGLYDSIRPTPSGWRVQAKGE